MMRRYVDASRTFQDILVFLSKISAVNSLSYQYDQMLKKQDPNRTKKYGTPGEASRLGDVVYFNVLFVCFFRTKVGVDQILPRIRLSFNYFHMGIEWISAIKNHKTIYIYIERESRHALISLDDFP